MLISCIKNPNVKNKTKAIKFIASFNITIHIFVCYFKLMSSLFLSIAGLLDVVFNIKLLILIYASTFKNLK